MEHLVICDVCGFELKAKDAILITDKYNLLYGLLVCPQDADKTNPQQFVRAVPEKTLTDPRYMRPEQPDTFQFISDASQIETGDVSNPSGTLPGAPKHPYLYEVSSNSVTLKWLGADTSGSGAIQGYKIERETPVGGGFTTITNDTQSVAMSYQDTGLSANTQYNYKISSVNRVGTSTDSVQIAITTQEV